MSINKPGLQKLNIGQQSSSSKTAFVSKLQSTSLSSKGYGVMAQRSNYGSIFSPKAYYDSSTAALRQSLNDSRVIINNGNYEHVHEDQGMSKFEKAMLITSGVVAGLGVVAGAIEAFSGDGKVSSTKATTSGTVEKTASEALSQLKEAKTSSEYETGLQNLAAELVQAEKDVQAAETELTEATKQKEGAEAELKTTEESITKENQNINTQKSVITKLDSQIGTLNMQISGKEASLAGLQSQLSSSGEVGQALIQERINTLQKEIDQLKSQMEDLKNQKQQAEESKAKSEQNLKSLGEEKDKLTTEIANCNKSIESAEAKKSNADKKKNEITENQAKYEKKFAETQQKEGEKLAKLHSELANYVKEYQNATDTDKKNKIAAKYADKANEYNDILKSSTTTAYTQVNVSISE